MRLTQHTFEVLVEGDAVLLGRGFDLLLILFSLIMLWLELDHLYLDGLCSFALFGLLFILLVLLLFLVPFLLLVTLWVLGLHGCSLIGHLDITSLSSCPIDYLLYSPLMLVHGCAVVHHSGIIKKRRARGVSW